MAIGRFGRQPKRPIGICLKMTAVGVLGLCFVVFWSMLSSSSSTLTSQRSSFGDISEPVASGTKLSGSGRVEKERDRVDKLKRKEREHENEKHGKRGDGHVAGKDTKKAGNGEKVGGHGKKSDGVVKEKSESTIKEKGDGEDEKEQVMDGEDGVDKEAERANSDDDDDEVVTDVEAPAEKEDSDRESETKGKLKKKLGPLFDPVARYIWKQCSTRSKHNYMPCIDFESSSGKIPSYRHHERSCPKAPPMCLVPLPQDGYEFPIPWPESRLKVYL